MKIKAKPKHNRNERKLKKLFNKCESCQHYAKAAKISEIFGSTYQGYCNKQSPRYVYGLTKSDFVCGDHKKVVSVKQQKISAEKFKQARRIGVVNVDPILFTEEYSDCENEMMTDYRDAMRHEYDILAEAFAEMERQEEEDYLKSRGYYDHSDIEFSDSDFSEPHAYEYHPDDLF